MRIVVGKECWLQERSGGRSLDSPLSFSLSSEWLRPDSVSVTMRVQTST